MAVASDGKGTANAEAAVRNRRAVDRTPQRGDGPRLAVLQVVGDRESHGRLRPRRPLHGSLAGRIGRPSDRMVDWLSMGSAKTLECRPTCGISEKRNHLFRGNDGKAFLKQADPLMSDA